MPQHNNGMAAMFGAQVITLLLALVGFAVGAYLIYHHAPVVGGEYWPYIRIVVSIIGGVIVGKVAAIVGVLFGIVVMALTS